MAFYLWRLKPTLGGRAGWFVSLLLIALSFFYPLRYCSYLAKKSSVTVRNCLILAILIIFNFGLLIVDHIL